jgi:hypothetical protein
MLPAEIWKHIALQYTVNKYPSPSVYTILSLVSCKFIIPTPILQEHYLRKYVATGDIMYKLTPSNKLHSPMGDLPAVVYADGCQVWCKNGHRHRDGDLPAVIRADGRQEWYKNDQCHRDGDLPAIIYACGGQQWYINGIFIK